MIKDLRGRFFLPLLAAVVLLSPLPSALAASPQEALKQRIDEVLELVRSQPYRQAEPIQRTQMLLDATEDLFDKREVAQRVLAVHWRSFSPQQRDEFIELFTDFLKNNYAQRIGAYTYENERVVFTEEVMVESKAIVKTMVITQDKKIPVDYAMLQKDGRWLVYDARIEGVSLVQNYRSQFNDILIRNSPEHLLEILRKRVRNIEG